MKLILDTTEKTIKIEESVNLKDLFEMLERLLPNGDWKEFKLETNTSIVWNNPSPIIINPYVPSPFDVPYQPTYPWYGKYDVQCLDGTTLVNDNSANSASISNNSNTVFTEFGQYAIRTKAELPNDLVEGKYCIEVK
jgi:hypothetical protein